MRRSTPTIFDIAREAGVSTSAVSYALNDKPGVSSTTRDHILEVARRLQYSPNSSARALARSRPTTFALVIARPPEFLGSDRFFCAFLTGAQSVLSRHGYTLSLDIPDPDEELSHYESLIAGGQVGGFFVMDLRLEDPRLALLADNTVNAVLVGYPVEGYPFSTVTLDEDEALAEAVDELVRLGHRRIATVTGPLYMVHAKRRLSVVRRALAAHGLTPFAEVDGDFSAASGTEAMTRLLARKQRPTAIVFQNDQMAIAGAATAASMGFRLPEDLSIIGIDDIDLAGQVHPPLTSISSAPLETGQRAAQLLVEGVQDGTAHSIGSAVLVKRSSIAPAPADAEPEAR